MAIADAAVEQPFQHIALSLSGGGVRALGFHLGTLDYLNRVGMLSKVHTLSSVSGGSLIAIGYALSQKTGESFQDFYDNVCEFLPELHTLEELLSSLNHKEPPVASGARTLITSLAQVYRNKYFLRYYDDPTFGIFWNQEPESHLKEIIFNATEFKTGFAFRFQKSEYECQIGNGKLWLDVEHAKQIRMSDIMAASSCIPGGMEPILFPQDFHWPGDVWKPRGKSVRPVCREVEDYLQEKFGTKSVPLMDGGVYDNQGISSVILTLARRYRGRTSTEESAEHDELAGLEPMRAHSWARWLLYTMQNASEVSGQRDMGNLDLFIVSDTPIRRDPMYATEPTKPSWKTGVKGWLRRIDLGAISNWGWILTVLLGLSAGLNVYDFLEGAGYIGDQEALALVADDMLWLGFQIVAVIIPVIVLLFLVVGLILLRRVGSSIAASVVDAMPPMRRSLWFYARRLRLGQIWDMVALRASSLTALASRIYMNRVRQLGYSLLYSNDEFEKRVIDNDINTLIVKRTGDMPEGMEASEAAKELIERAASMGTKLWIDKPQGERDDLDVLVAAGQLTICFNIIKYLWRNQRDEQGNLKPEVVAVYERACADWRRLNDEPFWLLDECQNAGRGPGVHWNLDGTYGQRRWRRVQPRKSSPA